MPSPNHSCYGRAVNITYFQYVPVDLVTQHAKRMRRIILTSANCLSVCLYHISPHCVVNYRIFGGKRVTEYKMCVFSSKLLSETFLILRRIERDISHKYT